ncbi:MAG TPA: hypothetical protein VFW87_27075 [Pirellulales bacterium]|nr:hypothetical protein [Pirellulales bacterium]
MPSTTESRNLSLQEKEAFVRSALSEMARHTFGCICSVIGVVDQKTGRHYGSALRCMLDGRRAILTALHVIEAARQEPLGLAISAGYARPPYIVHGPVNIDRVADMAVYFLPDDYPSAEIAVWPSTRIDHKLERLSTDYLFVHGFPGANSDSSRLLGGVLSKSLPYGAMQRLENLPPDLNRFQFAVEYDPVGIVNETGSPEDVVDPRGLSGSPVWRIGISGRSLHDWTPSDSLLAGVLTQWRPNEKILIATSMDNLPATW